MYIAMESAEEAFSVTQLGICLVIQFVEMITYMLIFNDIKSE